jgi:hypothetical protein
MLVVDATRFILLEKMVCFLTNQPKSSSLAESSAGQGFPLGNSALMSLLGRHFRRLLSTKGIVVVAKTESAKQYKLINPPRSQWQGLFGISRRRDK